MGKYRIFRKTLVNNYRDFIVTEVDKVSDMDALSTFHFFNENGQEIKACGCTTNPKLLEAPKKMLSNGKNK